MNFDFNLQQFLDEDLHLAEVGVDWAGRVLGVFVVFVLGRYAAGFLGKRITALLRKRETDEILAIFVGDLVDAGGIFGKVEKVSLFTSVLCTPDNIEITVPNGAIWGNVIRNMSSKDTRRVDVAVGVAYSADVDDAKRVLLEAVSGVEGVLPEPAPVVYLVELGASSVDFSVRTWATPADYYDVRERMTRACKLALDQHGINIPFPQMDVHLVKGE